jgi:hypothetical protein
MRLLLTLAELYLLFGVMAVMGSVGIGILLGGEKPPLREVLLLILTWPKYVDRSPWRR